ncbi:ACSM3 synthetase, partial [Pomatorhinus ruficollis]|nr:ACSM3 synthetase [Pomatorhinus ruficollis]
RYWMNLTPSDIMWNTSDTGWAKSAYGSVFGPWICGSCVFVHNMPLFKPEVVGETLSRYPITTFCTAPTAFRMLVQHDMSRYSREGKEAGLHKEKSSLMQTIIKFTRCCNNLKKLKSILQVGLCANIKGMKIKPGSLGKPLPPYDVQIIDDQGAVVPAGKEGTIAIRVRPKRPFCMFSGYL